LLVSGSFNRESLVRFDRIAYESARFIARRGWRVSLPSVARWSCATNRPRWRLGRSYEASVTFWFDRLTHYPESLWRIVCRYQRPCLLPVVSVKLLSFAVTAGLGGSVCGDPLPLGAAVAVPDPRCVNLCSFGLALITIRNTQRVSSWARGTQRAEVTESLAT
jgi:hypothetical protein